MMMMMMIIIIIIIIIIIQNDPKVQQNVYYNTPDISFSLNSQQLFEMKSPVLKWRITRCDAVLQTEWHTSVLTFPSLREIIRGQPLSVHKASYCRPLVQIPPSALCTTTSIDWQHILKYDMVQSGRQVPRFIRNEDCKSRHLKKKAGAHLPYHTASHTAKS